MEANFEIINFSFRNGIFCINLKDSIGNVHSVPFEVGYFQNDTNNYHLNVMHGYKDDYSGQIHIFITGFLGLYHILEKRRIDFINSNQPEQKIAIEITFDSDKPDLIIRQYSESLFVIIYYPQNKIHNIESSTNDADSFYLKYLGSFKLDEIFENKIVNTHQYFNHLADQGYEITESDYDFKTDEEREYESIDDEDAKRDAFPDLWLDEQISKADATDYWNEKQKELDEIEKNYKELNSKFKSIKLLDFEPFNLVDFKPSISLLVPSIFTGKHHQVIDIKLNHAYFKDREYYYGVDGNIVVNVLYKSFQESSEIELFKNEMKVELKYSFDYDYYKIYVDVIEHVEPPEDEQSEQTTDSELPF